MFRGHGLCPGQETIDIDSPRRYQLYLLALLPYDRQHVSGTYFEIQFIYQLTLVKCSAARRESITSQRDADPVGCEPCGRLPGSVTMLEVDAE